MFNLKKFDFIDYLENNLWKESKKNLYQKGEKTIRFVGANRDIMVVLNFSKDVKHKHVLTSDIPSSKKDADVLFKLTNI